MAEDHFSCLLPPGDEDGQAALLAEYRRLVRVELPAAAHAGKWTLRLDHCFARVVLDGVFGACWYERLERGRGRSAESQLDARQLARAVALARGMLDGGDAEVRRLNDASLAWRGKGPPTYRGASSTPPKSRRRTNQEGGKTTPLV